MPCDFAEVPSARFQYKLTFSLRIPLIRGKLLCPFKSKVQGLFIGYCRAMYVIIISIFHTPYSKLGFFITSINLKKQLVAWRFNPSRVFLEGVFNSNCWKQYPLVSARSRAGLLWNSTFLFTRLLKCLNSDKSLNYFIPTYIWCWCGNFDDYILVSVTSNLLALFVVTWYCYTNQIT